MLSLNVTWTILRNLNLSSLTLKRSLEVLHGSNLSYGWGYAKNGHSIAID